MSITNPSTQTRSVWPFFWLMVAIIAVPFLVNRVAAITFPELSPAALIAIWIFTFVVMLLLWSRAYGGGLARADRESILIIRDPTRGGVVVVPRGVYPIVPMIQKLEARLPTYSFRFEPTVEGIDTNTPMLSRIDKIRVRLDCRIKVDLRPRQHDKPYLTFFHKTASRHDLIEAIETQKKLTRADHELWKEFIAEVIQELVDDAIRDVVWNWKDPKSNDPTSLSKNRMALAAVVEQRLEQDLEEWGLELLPFRGATATRRAASDDPVPTKLMLELIEVNPEIIKGTLRDYNRMLKRAAEDAAIEAERLRQRGYAEADVRARTLALLLDELINKRGLSINDALVAQIVRSAFYSDGEMVWSGVLDRPETTVPKK